METTVRAYQADDAQPTWEVFLRAVHDTASQDYTPEQLAAWAPESVDLGEWDRKRLKAHTFVATMGGRVVGFGDLAEDGLLDMLFVHPDAGGRGVARALVTAIVGKARESGLSRLHTHASRTARPAFARFGFVVDRANLDNLTRGVTVPNYDMHLDLDG